ncbi:peroxisome assembly protein (Peroxin-2) [Kappamyces sp. JEL0680]|nr:peroxisome assembly protein (Peroxin-2) [Kappamyces sp. JEL0680]
MPDAPKPVSLSNRTLRSSQLDALELDEELVNLINDGIKESTSLFSPVWRNEWKPELETVVDFFVFSWPLLSGKDGTAGSVLHNLVYTQPSASGVDLPAALSAKQKWTYAVVRLLTLWGWKRGTKHMLDHSWSEEPANSLTFKVWKWVQKIELVWKTLSWVNFLVFLSRGKYRNLQERIFGFQLVHERRDMSRLISFEFMNRYRQRHQFYVALVPLLNFRSTKRYIKNVLGMTLDKNAGQIPPTSCLICHANGRPSSTITVPYRTNCNHLFCYYCIKSNMLSDPSFACPRCGEIVKEISQAVGQQ